MRSAIARPWSASKQRRRRALGDDRRVEHDPRPPRRRRRARAGPGAGPPLRRRAGRRSGARPRRARLRAPASAAAARPAAARANGSSRRAAWSARSRPMRDARPCQQAATPMPPCQNPGRPTYAAGRPDLIAGRHLDVDAPGARVAGPHPDRVPVVGEPQRADVDVEQAHHPVGIGGRHQRPVDARRRRSTTAWCRRGASRATSVGRAAARAGPPTPPRRRSSASGGADSSVMIASASRWPSASRPSEPSAAAMSASVREAVAGPPMSGAGHVGERVGVGAEPGDARCRIIVVEGDIGDQHGCPLPRSRPTASRLSLVRVTGRLDDGQFAPPAGRRPRGRAAHHHHDPIATAPLDVVAVRRAVDAGRSRRSSSSFPLATRSRPSPSCIRSIDRAAHAGARGSPTSIVVAAD